MAYAVETVELTKRYPVHRRYRDLLLRPFRGESLTALQDVSIRIKEGALVGLLGPNGAGKTTLIRVLCTLVKPSSGQVFVNSRDVATHPGQTKKAIGYVISEERSFYWRLTGAQNLRFFATLNNIPAARAAARVGEVLRAVGLEANADRMFKDYSSGMKQRLAIARGLLTHPRILMLDEPARALDPMGADELKELVRGIVAEEGRTVVYATNSLREADGLFDHVIVLDAGRVRVSAPWDSLRNGNDHAATYVLQVRAESGALQRALGEAPLASAMPRTTPDGAGGGACRLRVTTVPGRIEVSDIVAALVAKGVRIETCACEQLSLEGLFRRVVGSTPDEGTAMPHGGSAPEAR